MGDKQPYLVFDPGLDMNSQFLTRGMAYFLGGIYASEEQVYANNEIYRVAPVRYNYGAATKMEIVQHYEHVKALSVNLNGQTLMAENIRGTNLDSGKNRMPGFSTFFRVTNKMSLEDMIPNLKATLLNSDWEVRRSFLVGVFDGRSSADIDKKRHKIRMLALDCISDTVGAFLSEIVDSSGIRYNYNTHRDRLEGGRPRNPQLRIRDVDLFISKVGLISPRRINLIKHEYELNYDNVVVCDNSKTLDGLKTIVVR